MAMGGLGVGATHRLSNHFVGSRNFHRNHLWNSSGKWQAMEFTKTSDRTWTEREGRGEVYAGGVSWWGVA
jgi:hypothetical protein